MRWVRTYAPSGPAQAALRTSAANAQSSPRRSGTVIATFGVALFMLAAMSVLGSAQGVGLDRQSGGFDVIGTSAGAVGDQALSRRPGVAFLAAAPESLLPEPAFSVDTGRGKGKVPYPVRLIGANGALARTQGFPLASHLDEFPSAAAALGAVAADRDKAVLDRAALPEGAKVGDDVVIDIGSSPRRFRLIAVLDTFLLSGAFVNQAEFGELVPNRGNTMVFAKASDGVSPETLASTLEDAGRDAGLTVDPVAKLRDDVVAKNRTFTDTFAVMLVLALAVALASVAAYVALAVRERRGELALLRALGMRHRSVVLTLAAEPILTGALGATVGLAVGLVYLRVLFAVGFSELAFIVDWLRVGGVAAATILLLTATCLATARITTPRDLSAELRDIG
jgi:putative ABC transport system permease protein